MRRLKYGNKLTVVGGVAYHSKLEARRAQELRLLELAGEIGKVERQVDYVLYAYHMADDKAIKVCSYVADFVYFDRRTKEVIVEDVKGFRDRVYMLKKSFMLACHGIKIKEWPERIRRPRRKKVQ